GARQPGDRGRAARTDHAAPPAGVSGRRARSPAVSRRLVDLRVTAPLVVWRICDGKSGHDRQTAGLVAALRAEMPVAEHVIEAAAVARAPWLALRRRFPVGAGLPDPALIVGAGRRTQWPLIAARRARGGKSVYLMRPSLPARCFDLC